MFNFESGTDKGQLIKRTSDGRIIEIRESSAFPSGGAIYENGKLIAHSADLSYIKQEFDKRK